MCLRKYGESEENHVNEKEMLEYIPGTVMHKSKMGNVTGIDFLHKIYYISDGIKLSQVKEITGVDGTTLQNWVKRGWLLNPVNKAYGIDQLARILIINMMRDTVQLSRISFLLKYINGSVESRDDDIIQESVLYDYICKVLEIWCSQGLGQDLYMTIREVTAGYSERFTGARRRLERALDIIVRAYQATLIKRYTDSLIDEIYE